MAACHSSAAVGMAIVAIPRHRHRAAEASSPYGVKGTGIPTVEDRFPIEGFPANPSLCLPSSKSSFSHSGEAWTLARYLNCFLNEILTIFRSVLK